MLFWLQDQYILERRYSHLSKIAEPTVEEFAELHGVEITLLGLRYGLGRDRTMTTSELCYQNRPRPVE